MKETQQTDNRANEQASKTHVENQNVAQQVSDWVHSMWESKPAICENATFSSVKKQYLQNHRTHNHGYSNSSNAIKSFMHEVQDIIVIVIAHYNILLNLLQYWNELDWIEMKVNANVKTNANNRKTRRTFWPEITFDDNGTFQFPAYFWARPD